jgi:hypothetical protein
MRGFVLAAAAVALASLSVVGCGSTTRPIKTASEAAAVCANTRPAVGVPLNWCSLQNPLIVASRVSLDAARRLVKFPVPEADINVAKPANLTGVWFSHSLRAVALVYGSGDVAVTMTRAEYSDPRANYSTFLRENHATAKLSTVNGHVALVISPHSDAAKTNPAWVEFDDRGIDINVISATRGTPTLMMVAQSLAANDGT